MFRKNQDILLSTKTNIRKKEVKELRSKIKYTLANYTETDDTELFGNGNDIELLKLKSGLHIIKQKNGFPLFIQTMDQRFYPTVFALWKTPSIVPIIYTNSFVSSKIMSGAALMVPGISIPESGLPKLLNRTIVAIATLNNPKPFAIGYCCVGNFEEMIQSGKGKVIEVVHSYSDMLYEEYADHTIPEGYTSNAVYPILSTSVENQDDNDDVTDVNNDNITPDETKQESINEQVEISAPIPTAMTIAENQDESETNVNNVNNVNNVTKEPAHEVSEREMDDEFLHLCIRCFNEVGSEELPMQTSTFNSKYLTQKEFINKHFASEYYCGDVSDEKGLKWNCTSFKKLSKLMKYLDEKKLITLKDVNKQPTIVTVNWNHPWIQKYAAYIEHFKDDAVKIKSGLKDGNKEENTNHTSVNAVYKVNQILQNLFVAMHMDPKLLYTMAEAKSVLNGYIQLHSMVSPMDPSIIILNDEMTDALFRDKKMPKEGFPQTLERKVVAKMFEEKLIPYHAVQVNNHVVVKKGSCHCIEITTEKVKGARSLQTCVHHFNEFSLDSKELLKSLSKACASSGCIKTLNRETYIQIQGKVAPIVKDCLIKEFKVPTKYIHIKK